MKVLVGTPCYGGVVTVRYFHAFLEMKQALAAKNITLGLFTTEHESLITRARNLIANAFLRNPSYTHLLFIDADIEFPPDAVLRYLAAEKDIVCGIYPAKVMPLDRIRGFDAAVSSDEAKAAAFSYAVKLKGSGSVDRFGLVPVRYAATGFMLIRRGVLERMAEAYPHLRYRVDFTHVDGEAPDGERFAFFDTEIDQATGEYLPEDYAFCKRWADLGGEIHADVASKYNHVGSYIFQGDFFQHLKHRGIVSEE